MDDNTDLNCSLPTVETDVIQLAHGGGGRLMNSLLETVILNAFENPICDQRHDGAIFEPCAEPLAFTTDSYVVKPLFFPGGDIGSLAVNGTVNDLAMCGAKPLYLSVAFIIEEGFPIATLRQVVASMATAARRAGVYLVTGDTKVVDRGKGDGLFVNTAGVGAVRARAPVHPGAVEEGDVIILSGDLGRHGVAIMSAREHLAFETSVASDCAALWEPVNLLIEAGIEVHCLRDLTRGGLASALVEIAETAACTLTIEEAVIPVLPEVQAACDLLGLDPLYVANEGRFIAFVPMAQVAQSLELLRSVDPKAVAIGKVGLGDGLGDGLGNSVGNTLGAAGTVGIRGPFGALRRLTLFSGEQLPRIC